ncbi:AAA family ATPase [Streptomyces sp. NBC_01216]|uniref:AAA family ATPase n=1 Tax=Streptomyces sp. NBC_01216 TaxID=2903778 RepID=UPI002E10B9AC|nr:AAA family ATPase [Streptomyces sp. NBC_01216]
MPGERVGRPGLDQRAGFAFVGREGEMRALMAALRDGPSVVFVEGEAGVGKSRLLREVEHRLEAAGTLVLKGACHPLREPLPLGPAVDALRAAWPLIGPETRFGPATAVLAPYLPEITDRLTSAAGPEPREDTRSQLLMRAVHETLAALGPVVLMVEDLHWADEATRDLLLLLARNPPDRLRLVLTYRARDLPGNGSVLGSPYRRPVGIGGTEVSLGLLTEAQVRELATSAIGRAATGPLCRELFARSGGLPLAAEEDLLVIADRASRSPGGQVPLGLDGLAVPRALQEAVNSRVAPLGADAAAVIDAAAVLSVPAHEELLATLAALDEERAEHALTAALEANVLMESEPGRYGFRHVLARRAMYDRIPGPRRRRLHSRAVDVLSVQHQPPLVQIAHHSRCTGDIAAWLPRALAAADHAMAVGDDGVAGDLLGSLLAEPTLPPDERVRSALALSTIASFRADPAASVSVLRRIVADPGLPTGIRGEIRFHLVRTLTNVDAYWHDLGELDQAIHELDGRPALEAAAVSSLGLYSGIGEGDRPLAADLALIERATRLAAHSGDLVAQADVLANRIALLEVVGDPQGRALLASLPRRTTDRGVLRHCARALHNAAYYEMARGCDETARGLLGEAEELGRRTDSQVIELGCAAIRLGLDLTAGHWDGLDQRIEAMAQETPERSTIRLALVVAGATLDTARGQWARARQALVPLTSAANADIGPLALTSLARLDLLEGDAPSAWERAGRVAAVRRHKGLWARPVDLLPTAVEAALACGLRDDARRLVDEAAQGIRGLNASGVAAGVQWCHGLLAADADPEAALAYLGRARSEFEAIGRAHTAARVAEQAGLLGLARAAGRSGGAAHDLHHALDVFVRLGATADAARCEQALRNSGWSRPGPRRRTYGSDLSPRERQVAELLATGAANRDIARVLAISSRTAEHHVASTLKKLGVTRDRVREVLDTR